MFDEIAMRMLLRKKGKTLEEWANYLGIDRLTIYRKMSGESDFWRREIQKTCEFLGEESLNAIFFAQEVTETKQKE
mgnify:FL=1|jgi:transcriptional regulator with XRE-family HTH domain